MVAGMKVPPLVGTMLGLSFGAITHGMATRYLSEIIFHLRKVSIMQLMLLLLTIMDLLLLAISF